MAEKRKAIQPEEPTLEQWKQLYEVGISLKQLAPWRALRDTDILVLELPGQEQHIFCSVMGHGGENYAIGIYPGEEAFWRLSRVMEKDSYTPPYLLVLEQDCLLCNFGDREEVEPQDRDIMKALGLRFRGHNQWVYFRATTPGHFPWFLNTEQAQLLIEALQNVFMLCTYYMKGSLTPDFSANETLLRFYDENTAQWLNTVIPMPPVMRPHYSMKLADELLLARMKKSKKTKTVLELDWFYLPIPVQEETELPPHAPYMALIMDHGSGLPVAQHIAQPEEELLEIPPSLLVDYIQAHGRPSTIYTRCEEYATLLEDTCKSLGIKLIAGREMPAVDCFVEELLGMSGFLE